MKELDKIYKCLKSCETFKQFINANAMLLRYAMTSDRNLRETLFMGWLEDYALLKGRNSLLR